MPTMPARTIRLQYVGRVPAVEAQELNVGDTLMWNEGVTNTVTAIVDVSPKFLRITEKSTRTGEEHDRRMMKTRLVARVDRAKPEAVPADVVALAERFPVAAAAVYVPEEGEAHRDIVVVMSEPATDGTVQVHSVKHKGPVRVPLAGLRELPPLPPTPEGEITDWWVITDAEGAELARVEAKDDPGARTAAMRHASVRAAVRRDKGFAVRRLHSSELSIPVGELHGLPRISPAPAAERVPAHRTITVRTEFVGRSIPTRLRAAGAPGATATSSTGLLVWRLPGGEELTPGEAAKRFLGD
ncbi:hypothetical protein [Streptomyces niveus]|uniref:hypothetical protein n=1 Tax=Streptomyces niveus TaxID=193462 RepID=UPI00342EAF67